MENIDLVSIWKLLPVWLLGTFILLQLGVVAHTTYIALELIEESGL